MVSSRRFLNIEIHSPTKDLNDSSLNNLNRHIYSPWSSKCPPFNCSLFSRYHTLFFIGGGGGGVILLDFQWHMDFHYFYTKQFFSWQRMLQFVLTGYFYGCSSLLVIPWFSIHPQTCYPELGRFRSKVGLPVFKIKMVLHPHLFQL